MNLDCSFLNVHVRGEIDETPTYQQNYELPTLQTLQTGTALPSFIASATFVETLPSVCGTPSETYYKSGNESGKLTFSG